MIKFRCATLFRTLSIFGQVIVCGDKQIQSFATAKKLLHFPVFSLAAEIPDIELKVNGFGQLSDGLFQASDSIRFNIQTWCALMFLRQRRGFVQQLDSDGSFADFSIADQHHFGLV